MLVNLLSNALKFTTTGTIRIEASLDAERGPWRIAVHDTGIGIAAADRERIFEAFEQAGPPGTVSAGTGLGLAISRRLARLLGGDVERREHGRCWVDVRADAAARTSDADRAGRDQPHARSPAPAFRTRGRNRETQTERRGTRAFERREACGHQSLVEVERRDSQGATVARGQSSRPARAVAARATGKYVYCIIRAGTQSTYGPIGLGADPADVYTIARGDLAAVVSDAPLEVLDPTRDNVLAHQRVNETVMKQHTVLPMSFGTVFKTHDDVVELLRSASDAFSDVLNKMEAKLEFGLKVVWDRDAIIRAIEAGGRGHSPREGRTAGAQGLDLLRADAVRPVGRCRAAGEVGALCRGHLCGAAAERPLPRARTS